MSTSHSIPPTPTMTVPPASTPVTITCSTEHIIALIRGYGYTENLGIARRQQRSLTLLTQGHVTPLDLTLTAGGCPIVIRFRVQSEAGEGHYYVTRVPNETTPTYTCTCPDTWQPCKHAYAATLFQQSLHLAHTYRTELPPYDGVLATHPDSLGSHELTALRVLVDIAPHYHAHSEEAARQYYGARQSYASTCFSRFIDQVRWCYGTGYVGYHVDGEGELHSVGGTHVLHVRWHPQAVRWYIVSANGAEDVPRTRHILDAALPHWLQETACSAPDLPPPAPPFEEEPDGHYPLYHATPLSPSLELRERRYSDGSKPLFALGTVRTTVRAHHLLMQYGLEASTFVTRHVTGDWGTLNSQDFGENIIAFQRGYIVLSVYPLPGGELIEVLTEANRSATTVGLPDERVRPVLMDPSDPASFTTFPSSRARHLPRSLHYRRILP